MEPPELRLSDVCRSCLTRAEDMLSFAPKNERTSEIIAMLSSVGNIEIELNDFFPSYLCKTCEEKLRLSYDFQMLIRRSNELIRECLSGGDMVLGEEAPLEEKIKVEEEVIVNPVVRRPSKVLEEIAADEVEQAINEVQERFWRSAECVKCGFFTNNVRSLAAHMLRLHKEVKDKWCSFCNVEVDNLDHHTVSHAETHFRCKFCEKKCKTSAHLFEHLRGHSNVKPHKCYICQRGFVAPRHLEKHIRIHMNNRLYKCFLCPANFSTRKCLKQHLRRHDVAKTELDCEVPAIIPTIPRNFCEICKKRVRSLEKHALQFHNPEVAEVKKSEGILCNSCGKKFSCLSRFRLHMRTHTGETPYKCQYCDKRVPNRNQLVTHERTHTGEKPYVCNICGRGFSQTNVLNTHMRIHTGRPVSCDICGKRFCRNAQLRLHMRKHTGEKPYQCDQCEQAFKQASHLTEHKKRHSDARPYQCTHCEKSFKMMSTLKAHITIHTGEKPFKCSQCPYACRQRYSLTQHMKQHSADAPDPDKPHICTLCQRGYSTMAMLMSHTDLVHAGVKHI